MRILGSLDYGIILFYLAFLMSIGLYFTRRASRNLESYFLAGRSLPWWMLGTSGMASFLDMSGTMIITSWLFMIGPRGLFVEFRGGAVLVLAFMLCWTGKWHRRSGCMTGAEWMSLRFGQGAGATAARLLTAVAFIVTTVGMLAYLIRGAGMFLSLFVPIPPLYSCLILIGVGTLYTMFSGFYGVVFTDFFQSIIILVATLTIAVIAYLKVAACPDFALLAQNVTGNAQWMSAAPSWRTSMPAGYEPYQYLMMFTLFYLIRNVIAGMGTGADPKYFGARSQRECGKLSFLWISLMMFRWPMMMGFAVLGVFLVHDFFPATQVLSQAAILIKQYQPDVPQNLWFNLVSQIASAPQDFPPALIQGLQQLLGEQWTTKLSLLSFQGTVNPEQILPCVIGHDLPTGLRGVVFISIIAAAVTTFSSTVNGAAGYFVRDIYQNHLRPKAQNRELILVSYATSLMLVLLGYLMAYSTRSINDIWGWLMMGLGAGLAMPMLLRLYWWRFNGQGFAVGTFVGMAGAIVQRIVWPQMVEWQQFVILTILSLVGSLAGCLLFKPVDRGALEHFYRITRPFGLWGPLRSCLSGQQQKVMRREHLQDILALPFALLWQVTLFLLPMLCVIRATDAIPLTLTLFLVSLVSLYFLWYRNLPAKESASDATDSFSAVSSCSDQP